MTFCPVTFSALSVIRGARLTAHLFNAVYGSLTIGYSGGRSGFGSTGDVYVSSIHKINPGVEIFYEK